MTTDQVYIGNDGTGMEKALALTEQFSELHSLPRKDAMHLRLLVEETLGMVRVITGEFHALFWLEGGAHECRIFLEARTEMNSVKRSGLLSVSSSGRNSAARGLMGKIRELIETGIENYQEVDRLQMDYGIGSLGYGAMGIDPADAMSQAVLTWSLQQYTGSLFDSKDEDEIAEEAWDELEKSIVGNIADDVRVGIRKERVEMVIYKKFGAEKKLRHI